MLRGFGDLDGGGGGGGILGRHEEVLAELRYVYIG